MSKITIDRSVVEQALEALNASMPHNNDMDEDWPSHIAARRALRTALEQPQVEQETKSYKVTGKTGEFCVFHSTEVKRGDMVYTHPQPPRQPLTSEAIDAIIKSNFVEITNQNLYDAIYLCMRDVESAHDIKE